jgi:TetR/AcrR family fatty acid metabolism transcriptional regulator
MQNPDPIQAQLIEARRSQILDAAAKVFADKGFHRATIKDVAKAAGIADGTIYNYFENKTGLIVGLLDRFNETSDREDDFGQAVEGDMREWFRAYLKQRYITLQPQGFELFRVLISELLIDEELRALYVERILKPTYEIAEKFFREWQAAGIIKQTDPQLAMRVGAGTFLGLVIMHLIGDETLQNSWDKLPDVVADIILNGLMPGGSNE